jgi:hypothetical protein
MEVESRMPDPKRGEIDARIELVGAPDAERPVLAVHAVAPDGEIVATAKVTADGRFRLPAAARQKDARVLIGSADADPHRSGEAFLAYRMDELPALLADGVLRVGESRWRDWLGYVQCVSGSVRRCYPWLTVIEEIATRVSTGRRMIGDSLDLSPVDALRTILPHRCGKVCQGVVEVYRRTCCCQPPIVVEPWEPTFEWPFDPPIPLPDPLPFPPDPDPGPIPIPPGPGPDPAPFDRLDRVATSGALDVRKLNAPTDLVALRTLKGTALREYVVARPYLWCTCGWATKVAQGLISDDGTFSVCWKAPLEFLIPGCRREYAYKVKQSIDGSVVTIYDGVAAGQWFDDSDSPTLTSYHLSAVSCTGDPEIPGMGDPIVLLHEIGHTESHHLASPDQDSPESVNSPLWNSGLLHPASTDGPGVNRPLGAALGLRYFFSHGMKSLGARFFRVQATPANGAGDPAGPWSTVPVPTWSAWKWTGAGWIRSYHSLADTNGLFVIPYHDVDLLAPLEEWDPDQYHAVLDTRLQPNGKYLVKIEVFDNAGNQIKPTGAAGPGTQKAFTFGRWKIPAGPPDPVPYSALTHFLWWDNRPATVAIDAIRLNGAPSSATCQFLEGSAGATVAFDYRAYHPWPGGSPSFLRGRSLWVTKGLNGPTTWLVSGEFTEVGESGPAETSPGVSLGSLLGSDTKCAFAARVFAGVKTTDGSGTLTNLDRDVTAAFAADII